MRALPRKTSCAGSCFFHHLPYPAVPSLNIWHLEGEKLPDDSALLSTQQAQQAAVTDSPGDTL